MENDMPIAHRIDRNKMEMLAFGHYLRTGQRIDVDDVIAHSGREHESESKFNPYHDPDDGRFTFGPGGGSLAPRNRAGAGSARQSQTQRGSRTSRSPAPLPSATKLPPVAAAQQGPEAPNPRVSAFLRESEKAWKGSDGVPNDSRWEEWAKRPASLEHFSSQSNTVVDHIRTMDWTLKSPEGDRVMKFLDVEKHVMDKSTEFWARNVIPPYVREHAIFVYQNIAKPGEFTARIVTGAGATGMGQSSDFTTRKPLELWQLPQISGYRLIMVEHTHPVAVDSKLGARGHAAPSNADMYIAAANPGVKFVVNQAMVSGLSNKVTDNRFIYFGF